MDTAEDTANIHPVRCSNSEAKVIRMPLKRSISNERADTAGMIFSMLISIRMYHYSLVHGRDNLTARHRIHRNASSTDRGNQEYHMTDLSIQSLDCGSGIKPRKSLDLRRKHEEHGGGGRNNKKM